MFDCSKSESLRDVSVTKIGDALSYGFPQTDYEIKVISITINLFSDKMLPFQVITEPIQAIPGNDQNASPTNEKTAGSKLDRTS